MSEPRWIRTPEELKDVLRSLEGAASLALDTESDSFHHYREKVCLLQLALPSGEVALIDPLAVADLAPLRPAMADPAIEKVLHGAEYDIALMKRDFGFVLSRLFDTQIAARFLGRTEFGLQSLLQAEFGVTLSKTAQRDDWSRRPLSPIQERYAAEDVRHLMSLRDRLAEALRAAGRESWVREECDAMAETPAAVADREAADFLKAKGAREMQRPQLAMLRELFDLRERWARELDRPRFKLVGDDALVTLTLRPPKEVHALQHIRGLSPWVKRHGEEILEAIRRGQQCPSEEWPSFRKRSGWRMSYDARRRIDRLKSWRAKAAEQARLDPGLLLPQRLIEPIALGAPKGIDDLARIPGIRRWRVEVFGDGILGAAR